MKKLEKKIVTGTWHDFLESQIVHGKLEGVYEKSGQWGDYQYLRLIDEEGEIINVTLKSSLQGYDWHEVIGKIVEIEFTGKKKNPKTGRSYFNFEVSVEE